MASTSDVHRQSSPAAEGEVSPSATPSHTISSQTASQPTTLPLQMTSSNSQSQETSRVPMRHPRPLSAAELHMELEKEQEAVVNRLTRELAALRAQTASVASVASNASTSTSASAFDATDSSLPSATSVQPSTTRNRSSSNLSARSSRSSTLNLGVVPPSNLPSTSIASTAGTSQASMERARDAAGITTTGRSRQNSTVAPGRSGAPSPSVAMHPTPAEYFPNHQSFSSMSSVQGVGSPRSLSRSSSRLSSARYEEAQQARVILDQARTENEILVKRVKELEREIRNQSKDHPNDQAA